MCDVRDIQGLCDGPAMLALDLTSLERGGLESINLPYSVRDDVDETGPSNSSHGVLRSLYRRIRG